MNLDKQTIQAILGEKYSKLPIFIYNSIGSTNQEAKIIGKQGDISRAVFIAECQTAGRGRLGRSFASDEGKGLYLSLLTEGGLDAEEAIGITTYMAVTASDVIEELTGIDIKIKWVNDLYAGEKKLGGILTEGEIAPNGRMLYSVVGIGVNILKREFSEELKNIATTVEDEAGKAADVNVLAGRLIKSFFDNIQKLGSHEIAEKYKARSFLIGKRVNVIKKTHTYPATVLDITDKCMLRLLTDSGCEELLSTGEVSIREA